MKRIENILLSKAPVWIVVVLLALGAAGTVAFGALVEYTATRKAKNLDTSRTWATSPSGSPRFRRTCTVCRSDLIL